MTELSPRTQDRILAILSGLDDASFTPNADRRGRMRIAFRHEAVIQLLSSTGEAKLKIHTRNLSTSGVGFLSRRPFQKGDRFAFPIKMPGTPSKLVLCRATFSRYVSGGLYDVGAEFEKAIADPREEQLIPKEWIDLASRERLMSA